MRGRAGGPLGLGVEVDSSEFCWKQEDNMFKLLDMHFICHMSRTANSPAIVCYSGS